MSGPAVEPVLAAVVVVSIAPVDGTSLPGEWTTGPLTFVAGSDAQKSARTAFYANPDPVEELLHKDCRWHVQKDMSLSRALDLVAAELVATGRGATEVPGRTLLMLHLRGTLGTSVSDAVAALALVVRNRPTDGAGGRTGALAFAIGQLPGGAGGRIEVVPSARVWSLALTGPPVSGDTLIRWGGSETEQRLADLTTLPVDRRDVSGAFTTGGVRPTPSYWVASSSSSIGVVRVRTVTGKHEDRLRTTWLDAMLVELVQHSTVLAMVRRLQEQVEKNDRRGWSELERGFRTWRSAYAWQATTDHAMEAGIAGSFRASLGTDALVDRVEREIVDYIGSRSVKLDLRLAGAALAVSVAAFVISMGVLLS